MCYKKKLFIYFILIFLNFKSVYSYENKILIRVDNELITSVDLFNESNYLKAVNQNLKNLEDNKIFEIAKNSLIKEKIRIKEILKYTDKLMIEDKYLSLFIKSTYENQNFSNLNEFINHLNQFNIDINYLKKKISIEIIWNELIFSKFSNNVKINKDKIKAELQKDISKPIKEYFLSEIKFDIPLNSNLESKIQSIENDIKEKGFKNAILLHSISSSTTNNGEIGWINESSLSIEIKEILSNLNIGDYTKPITVPGGFLILKIDDMKLVERKNFDLNKKIDEIINLKTNEQLNNYSNIYFNKIKKEYLINEEL